MNEPKLKKGLVENALDFLTRAIEEFETRPKYSIINFYTAVELFLKARLLHEHWSLVVQKEPDRKKFEAGDFVSVTFEEACGRLEKVVQSGVPDTARVNFDNVRKHRNKMVHFFHKIDGNSGPDVASIATEQLRAWYDLHQLLVKQWSPIFAEYGKQFVEIEGKLARHRGYLRAKFDGLNEAIIAEKRKGVRFLVCGSCKFRAARVTPIIGDLFDSTCLVCDYSQDWFNYKCAGCDRKSALYEGGVFTCKSCGKKDELDAIKESINEFVVTSDNYFDARVPANCSFCERSHAVVEYQDKYMCVNCFAVTDHVSICGWCSEYNNGDMEGSYAMGCSECDGRIGWDKDD